MSRPRAEFEPVRWGILGCARIAQRRLAPAMAASPMSTLHAVASRDLDKAERFRKECSAAKACGSYDELLADPDVEAVYNPLPNSLHAEWTIAALQAGKHVLCEKPLATCPGDVARMFDAAEAADRRLMEAFMWRFHPRSRQVKRIVEVGRIGELKVCRVSFAGMMTPESHPGNIRMSRELGGGAMLDLGCYAVCAARWFFGAEPVRAVATAARDPQSGIDVHLCGTLTFAGERYAQIQTSWRTWFRQEYDLLGAAGSVRVEQAFVAMDGNFDIHLRERDETRTVTVAGEDPYRLELEHFCRVVRGVEEQATGRADAMGNAAAIDALFRAAECGRAVGVTAC